MTAVERDAILARIAADGGQHGAWALLCLHGESPRLAAPILEHIARLIDDVDELLCALGDAGARDAQLREVA